MPRAGLSPRAAFALAILAALGAGAGIATQSPRLVEKRLAERIGAALSAAGIDWARVEADGLRATLRGEAPYPDARDAAMLTALSAAGVARVTDLTTLAPPPAPPPAPEPAPAASAGIAAAPEAPAEAPPPPGPPPAPALLLTREGDRLALAGRMPPGEAERLAAALADQGGALSLADLALPSAPPPDETRWRAELALALDALGAMESGAVEARPGTLKISGWIGSDSARRVLERRLREAAPEGVTLMLRISAPPPVFRPFRFVAMQDGTGVEVLACHVQSAAEGRAIDAHLTALRGAPASAGCEIGLGAPSGDWGEAAEAALDALSGLARGRVALTDRDVSFSASAPARPERFERAASRLQVALGDGWALHLSGPPLLTGALGGEEDESLWFAARRRDGRATLSGRAPDEATREALIAYARARFGPDAAREDLAEGLAVADEPPPPSWRRAALASLDALGSLSSGAAAYDGRRATVSGAADGPVAAMTASRALDALEAETGVQALSVVTVDLPARADLLPLGPRRCLDALASAQGDDPIGFEPGSPRIIPGSAAVLDRLAGILRRCGGLVVQIEGHTDSQGRETTNMTLSRGRAEAVLEALRARGAPGWRMAARGYGESRPIADNGTEDGRAANRRIEFSYHGPEPDFAPATALPVAETPALTPPEDAADESAAPDETPADDIGADDLSSAEDGAPDGTGTTEAPDFFLSPEAAQELRDTPDEGERPSLARRPGGEEFLGHGDGEEGDGEEGDGEAEPGETGAGPDAGPDQDDPAAPEGEKTE